MGNANINDRKSKIKCVDILPLQNVSLMITGSFEKPI